MLIQDIRPYEPVGISPAEEAEAWEAYVNDTEIAHADNARLIKELYDRGVTIRDIFGRYYEFDEMGSAQSLIVEDARIAGLGGEVTKEDIEKGF